MVTQSTVDTLEDLREDFELARAGNSFQFYPALNLKIGQMRRYLSIQFFYFGYELIINGLIPTFAALGWGDSNYDDNMDPYAGVKQHFFDLAIMFAIMMNFRARNFPEYYHLGLREEEEILL